MALSDFCNETIKEQEDISKAILDLCEKAYQKGVVDRGLKTEMAECRFYKRGYADAEKKHNADLDYKNGLEDGRMEAWECAKKINDMTMDECELIFGEYRYLATVLDNITASEAIAKMKEWENSWHIKMPFENIHGELYCKYSDVQKLYEQMKGESK